jgi:hypothetical protein
VTESLGDGERVIGCGPLVRWCRAARSVGAVGVFGRQKFRGRNVTGLKGENCGRGGRCYRKRRREREIDPVGKIFVAGSVIDLGILRVGAVIPVVKRLAASFAKLRENVRTPRSKKSGGAPCVGNEFLARVAVVHAVGDGVV